MTPCMDARCVISCGWSVFDGTVRVRPLQQSQSAWMGFCCANDLGGVSGSFPAHQYLFLSSLQVRFQAFSLCNKGASLNLLPYVIMLMTVLIVTATVGAVTPWIGSQATVSPGFMWRGGVWISVSTRALTAVFATYTTPIIQQYSQNNLSVLYLPTLQGCSHTTLTKASTQQPSQAAMYISQLLPLS